MIDVRIAPAGAAEDTALVHELSRARSAPRNTL
jgi:hypothetical protein